MEDALISAAQEGGSVGGFVIIRPTLMFDTEPKGLGEVRVGWEWPNGEKRGEWAPGPQLGVSISRVDVGNWVFSQVVRGGGKWVGKCVSLASC